MIALSNKSFTALPAAIRRPNYDRDRLTAGIVHIGLGNFHRAHQSWYLHRLMQQGVAHDWAIVGAGVREYDKVMRSKLAEQDYLTTLIELGPDGISAEIVGPMINYLPVEESNAALIRRIACSDIRIVSLTVTEGGYYVDPGSGGFEGQHPDIVHDIQNPDAPRTAFGAIVAALKLRLDDGLGPIALQSCDNLLGNGDVLRQTVVSLARLQDPPLADWIDENCSFPNSMVDCIVPSTGQRELDLVQSLGLSDAAPVSHENFRQWVMEDDFCAGRPEWDRAGATFSDNVHGFEMQKIRILNAGHQVLAGAAEIIGLHTISDAMEHDILRSFFHVVMTDEVLPHVASVPGMSPETYLQLVATRFSNPTIADTVRRVAFDGSSRHPGFVLPSIRDALKKGAPFSGLALVEALWAKMCEGIREDGSEIAENDPMWLDLNTFAKQARTEPKAWLGMKNIYGDIAEISDFADTFEMWLRAIYNTGTEATLRLYLEGN
ncbi:MAG: mannitol dehydrogenase family protein [Ruegeria sp.]